jgi:hypothetical protein
MADNIAITQGSGTTIATDDVSGVQYQVVKISAGADGLAGSLVDWTTGTAGSPAGGVQSVQGVSGGTPVPVTSGGYDVATTVTRGANVTPYTAGDVVGGALDLGALGPSAGAVMITGAQLLLNLTSAATVPSGMTSFRLYLYSVTPPSAYADNAQWGLPTSGITLTGDRASYLGFIDLGSPVNLGVSGSFTPYCEANGINKQVRLTGTKLFGYLVTNGGYTPAANSEIYTLTMHTVAV